MEYYQKYYENSTNSSSMFNESISGTSSNGEMPVKSINLTNLLLWFLQAKQKKPILYEPPTSVVILLSFLYGSICLIALVGNLIVLWLVLGSKRMRSVTNLLISNLCIVDVIISLFLIPFQFQAALFQRWDLPNFLCPVCPSVQIFCLTLSMFTLSMIAVHRYRGIMSPLKPAISKQCTFWALLVMWLLSFFIALPTAIDYRINRYRYKDGTIIDYCQNTWLSDSFRAHYNRFVVIIQYVLPLIVITVTYMHMGRELWRQETPGNVERSRDEIIIRNKKKVTKIMVLVIIMFAIFWLPFQSYNFLLTIFPSINDFSYINMVWFTIHWLAMSNSCCNPFIYGMYNEKFKQEFRQRLERTCLRRFLLRNEQVRVTME